jgi:hypothetical protein
MPDEESYRELVAELEREFPRFRIVPKSGDRLSAVIDRALKIMTVGGQSSYLTEYRTVIGDTLYVPDGWAQTPAADRIICLRHERVHLRQRRRYTMVGMALLYLALPLPVGLAYFRARMEWEAYRETLRATLELKGQEAVLDPELRAQLLQRFVGPAYLWMWPFPQHVAGWFDEALAELGLGLNQAKDDSATSSTIPTMTDRTGPVGSASTCRAPVPSSSTSTRSPTPASTESTAMMYLPVGLKCSSQRSTSKSLRRS